MGLPPESYKSRFPERAFCRNLAESQKPAFDTQAARCESGETPASPPLLAPGSAVGDPHGHHLVYMYLPHLHEGDGASECDNTFEEAAQAARPVSTGCSSAIWSASAAGARLIHGNCACLACSVVATDHTEALEGLWQQREHIEADIAAEEGAREREKSARTSRRAWTRTAHFCAFDVDCCDQKVFARAPA